MDDLIAIVGIQMEQLNKLLAERGLEIGLTPAAERFLAEKGYDPAYGARPVKRTIQQLVQDPLALFVLEGRFREGDRIRVDVQDGHLVFERAEA